MPQHAPSGFISYGKQSIEEEDIQAMVRVMNSEMMTQGPEVKAFEAALSESFGARHAFAVNSGTAALHLSGKALGWKPGDVVLTTPMTFLASANCILYAGATPRFVDIEPQTYTIDPEKVADAVEDLKKQNQRVRAVVAVDYAGHPCDWKRLRQLADLNQFDLVDDACHAPGATYHENRVGDAVDADAVALSFHPVKHFTTGEGGAVLTNREDIAHKVNLLRTHGITKDPQLLEENPGPWYYEMHELGWNYRITDFQCALGSSQLKRLNSFVSRRNQIAQRYHEALKDHPLFELPQVARGATHAWHLYPLQIDFDKAGVDKAQFFLDFRSRQIGLQVHYIPVHFQPFYQKLLGDLRGQFPVAERFYHREVSLPMYPNLSESDQDYVIENLLEYFR